MAGNEHPDDDISSLLRIGLDDDLDQTKHVRHPSSWDPPSVEDLQRALPQYEISEFIARGGMGAVYKGTQKALQRTVAIKVLPHDVDEGDGQFAARFQREAKAMARLAHPNIVAVYEAGETPDGWLYIVMEFIDGTDVGQLIAGEGFVDPLRAIRITSAVCEALAFAHEEGIIHRDIKPSNIMLDKKGRVKVGDFGLARMTNPDHDMRTGTNLTMGTADFIAPEALAGGTKVDQRADIYAVGVMLYQMLTGKIPRGKFSSPSSLRPNVDTQLDAVVDMAMQTNREQRYSNASEMKTAVDKVVQSFGSHSTADTQRAEPTKRGGQVRAAALTGLAAAVGAGAFLFLSRSKPDAPRISESPSLPVSLSPALTAATKDAPFVNSLGMKFVPVPIKGGPTGGQRVLFSVWDTRVQDYATFATETKRGWEKPKFEQGPTHPVVNVLWEDATAFCAWLTDRERKAGKLGANESYRLPSDHEWSCGVGIGEQEDAELLPTENELRKTKALYPWGSAWPPPQGAGNYASEEMLSLVATEKSSVSKGLITGYSDGYANTSPVGSFASNRFGLYDMSGNVWQWCEDWYEKEKTNRVRRGGSWNSTLPNHLGPSKRHTGTASWLHNSFGFRCVLSDSPPPSAVAPSSFTTATKDVPFVNSFGMKFVPVPILGGPTGVQRVLFSVWDTRVQDYEVFVGETKREWPAADFPQEPTHPAVHMTWDDAQLFCQWLTAREHATGRLGAHERYRLPSDHEWSCAVEIGVREDAAKLPFEKDGMIADVFPWGTEWPPPKGAGNYGGEESLPDPSADGKRPAELVASGYNDGFVNTSPVGSFAANRFGLHDLGGNVRQWCEDWFDQNQKERVLRGASWNGRRPGLLLSSRRSPSDPTQGGHLNGFRCVLADAESTRPSAPSQ